MSNSFIKIIVTTLTLVITYANIIAGSFNYNTSVPYNKSKAPDASEYLFESKSNLCSIQRTQESIYSVIESLYSFSCKNIQDITLERIHIYEQKLNSSSFKYIKFASNIEINCTTKQLIYPFDYFWWEASNYLFKKVSSGLMVLSFTYHIITFK